MPVNSFQVTFDFHESVGWTWECVSIIGTKGQWQIEDAMARAVDRLDDGGVTDADLEDD